MVALLHFPPSTSYIQALKFLKQPWLSEYHNTNTITCTSTSTVVMSKICCIFMKIQYFALIMTSYTFYHLDEIKCLIIATSQFCGPYKLNILHCCSPSSNIWWAAVATWNIHAHTVYYSPITFYVKFHRLLYKISSLLAAIYLS